MKGSTFKRCPCGTVRDAQGNRINCQKKHGTWYYAHELPPGPDGRRRQSRVGGFATEREAREALNEVLSQIQRGTYRFRTKQTVGEYLHRWLDGKANLRATTRRSYTETIRLYLEPGIGHIQLTDLRPEDVEALFEAMRQVGRPEAEKKPSPTLRRLLEARQSKAGKPMSDARIKRVHATLMSALNTAVKRQLITYNPAKHVEVRQGRRPKAVVWTDEQIASWKRTGIRPAVAVWTAKQTGQFLDAASSERLYPLFHVIAYRGLRRGEAVGLRWEDVDLDRAQMRIRQQVVQLGWETQIGEPKSASGARPVSLDANTVQVLREWRAEQQRERQAMGDAWHNTGFVFTDIDGAGLHPDVATDTFQRIARGAGLPPIRLHDLRHTSASLALAAGVPMKVVSELLGHSSTVITADTYTSVLPEVATAAAEAVFQIIPRGSADDPAEDAAEDPENGPSDGDDAVPFPIRSQSAESAGTKRTPRHPHRPRNRRSDRVGPVGLEPTTRGLKVDSESAAQTLKVPVSSRNASQPLSSILVRLEPLADSLRTPKRVLTVSTTRHGAEERQQTRSSLIPPELAA